MKKITLSRNGKIRLSAVLLGIVLMTVLLTAMYQNQVDVTAEESDEKKFSILEIVPDITMGEIGYLIPGQEPVNMADLNTDTNKAKQNAQLFARIGIDLSFDPNSGVVTGYQNNNTEFLKRILGDEMAGRVVVSTVEGSDVTKEQIDAADLVYFKGSTSNADLTQLYSTFHKGNSGNGNTDYTHKDTDLNADAFLSLYDYAARQKRPLILDSRIDVGDKGSGSDNAFKLQLVLRMLTPDCFDQFLKDNIEIADGKVKLKDAAQSDWSKDFILDYLQGKAEDSDYVDQDYELPSNLVQDNIYVSNQDFTSADIFNEVNDSDLFQKVKDKYKLETVTVADVVKYILDSQTQEPESSYIPGTPIRVLEIQPSADFKFDTKEEKQKLLTYLGVHLDKYTEKEISEFCDVITVVCRLTNAVNGMREDFLENYDLIYIGDNIGNITQELSPVGTPRANYRDNTLDGYLYTAVGDAVPTQEALIGSIPTDYVPYETTNNRWALRPNTASNLKYWSESLQEFFKGKQQGENRYYILKDGNFYDDHNLRGETRSSGTDLTLAKTKELKEYADAGMPILMAPEVYASMTGELIEYKVEKDTEHVVKSNQRDATQKKYFSYQPTGWSVGSNEAYINISKTAINAYKQNPTAQAPASYTVHFTGSSIKLMGWGNATHGIMQFELDGKVVGSNKDSYSSGKTDNLVLFDSTAVMGSKLEEKEHTLTVKLVDYNTRISNTNVTLQVVQAQVVSFDKITYAQDIIDPESYLAGFLDEVKDKKTVAGEPIKDDDNQAVLVEAWNSRNQRPVVTWQSGPNELLENANHYDSEDLIDPSKAGVMLDGEERPVEGSEEKITVYPLKYEFLIDTKDISPANIRVDFYIDRNGDGQYSEKERRRSLGASEMTAVGNGLLCKISYDLTSNSRGMIPWKIVVTDTQKHTRWAKIGYSVCPAQDEREVNILQIAPNRNGKLNMNDPRFMKYLNPVMANEKYNIHIDVKTTSEFLKWYEEEPYDAATGQGDRLNGKYNMLILGFGETWGGNGDISNEHGALDNIENYINTGQSVMFTHDTTSYTTSANYYYVSGHSKTNRVETDPNLKPAEATGRNEKWGYQVSQKFRDYLGMDRYANTLTSEDRNTKAELILGTGKTYQDWTGAKLEYGVQGYQPVVLNQGFTLSMLWRLSLDKEGWAAFSNIGGYDAKTEGGYISTDTIDQLNKGQITQYPYLIDSQALLTMSNGSPASTHTQYYQLDLEDVGEDDITVWYTLGANPKAQPKGSVLYYQNTPMDAINNYYIYSKGNITFAGSGHNDLTSSTVEMKIFINAMVAAIQSANIAPKAQVVNGIQNQKGDKILYVNEYDRSCEVQFQFSDGDFQHGSDLEEYSDPDTSIPDSERHLDAVRIYIDKDGNGIFNQGDIAIKSFDNKKLQIDNSKQMVLKKENGTEMEVVPDNQLTPVQNNFIYSIEFQEQSEAFQYLQTNKECSVVFEIKDEYGANGKVTAKMVLKSLFELN